MFDLKILSFCLIFFFKNRFLVRFHVSLSPSDLSLYLPAIFCVPNLKLVSPLAPVWKWEPAAGVGQAGERARGAGEAEEAAAPGGAGPGAGHRPQQGRHVHLLTSHDPRPSFNPSSYCCAVPLIHRFIISAPALAPTCGPPVSNLCRRPVNFQAWLDACEKTTFKNSLLTNLQRNHNQERYGSTSYKAGFILQFNAF